MPDSTEWRGKLHLLTGDRHDHTAEESVGWGTSLGPYLDNTIFHSNTRISHTPMVLTTPARNPGAQLTPLQRLLKARVSPTKSGPDVEVF